MRNGILCRNKGSIKHLNIYPALLCDSAYINKQATNLTNFKSVAFINLSYIMKQYSLLLHKVGIYLLLEYYFTIVFITA